MPPQPKLVEPSKPWTQSYASIPIREASWSVERRCGWHNSPRPDIGNCQRAHWSCGWPDARDACKARPTIEAQGLASPHHHSPAWPHRPIKTRPSPLLFPPPLLCLSHLFPSLYLSLFSLVLPLPILTKQAHTFLFSHFASLIAVHWKKKDEERGMRLRERDRENQRERGSYHRTSMARTNCTGPLK